MSFTRRLIMYESRLKKLLKKDLTRLGWFARKLVATGNGGFPDIIATAEGVFIGIEAKTLDNKSKPFDELVDKWSHLQIHDARELITKGNHYMLVGSNDKREVFTLIWHKSQTYELPEVENKLKGACMEKFVNYDAFLKLFFDDGYIGRERRKEWM